MSASAPYTRLPQSPTRHDFASASFLFNEKASSRQPSLLTTVTSVWNRRSAGSRKLLGALAFAGCVFVVVQVSAPVGSAAGTRAGDWDPLGAKHASKEKRPVDFQTSEVPDEWACNPFKATGRLLVDTEEPTNNLWKPFDQDCPPSTLMKGLYVPKATAEPVEPLLSGPFRTDDASIRLNSRVGEQPSRLRPHYPWLVNATILLQGDSMERLHLNDFCILVGGVLTNIDPSHPASPPIYRKQLPTILGPDGLETSESIEAKALRVIYENQWDDRPSSWPITRPNVCDVKEYGATIISVFTWGLRDMEPVFQSEDFFHGPSTWVERFHHITLPLLRNLATLLDRPQILHPTFIELASGFWDLRGFTEEDFIVAGMEKPYPKDSEIPFEDLGEERESKWAEQAQEVLKLVATTFPGEKGVRDGPVISWRTLHHPHKNNYTPYSRVFGLDNLARKTLHDLRVSSLATRPSTLNSARCTLLNAKARLLAYGGKSVSVEGESVGERIDYGFDERIRVSEFGALLVGQEGHFNDFLHPSVLPGSYLWSDMMLYELKRAVARIGRSS